MYEQFGTTVVIQRVTDQFTRLVEVTFK
jgi:hypothetical protein